MQYYTGLLKKDWKLAQKGFLQNCAVLFIVWMTIIGASVYWKEPGIAFSIGAILVVSHLFYIAIDIYVNLSKEAKLKQWLHNPNPAHSLLSSKLIISLATCCISLLGTMGLVLLSGVILQEDLRMEKEVGDIAVVIYVILLVGLYLGIWSIAAWTVMTILRKKRIIQFLIILLAWPIFFIHQHFISSSLYLKLKDLGTIPFIVIGTIFEEDEVSFGLEMGESSLALLGIFTVVSILLLWLSIWCIDKKMEL